MKDRAILPTYPGFTRRAVTFTIDDGNLTYDEKFIAIVRSHGIRGTFNLCSRLMNETDDFYRAFYDGFGIANHTSHHPYAFDDAIDYIFTDEPMGEQGADERRIYPSPRGDGYYMKHFPQGWRELADNETYMTCVAECQRVLERIFGKSVGFVWPYSEQNNAQIRRFIDEYGFASVRKTGDLLDTTDFALPADRMAWSYNCHDTNLLDVMKKYEASPDNGKLRFFAFGVHSIDFERNSTWDDLLTFAEAYGNRPSEYWSAPVDEIFAYADAMDRLTVTDTEIINSTEIPLYVELGGERLIIPPHTTLAK